MSPRDHAEVLAQHRTHERMAARQCRRRPDLTNEVRRSLIDDCSKPGTVAHAHLLDYNADNECDLSAVAFIVMSERINSDLWADALLHARRSDADARRNSYLDPQEGWQ